MNLFRFLPPLLVPALATAAAYASLGTGPLGEINARDGDRAFNAVLAGAPAVAGPVAARWLAG